jgi:hypothetical protein
VAATFFTPHEETLASTRPKAAAPPPAKTEPAGNSRLWHDPLATAASLPQKAVDAQWSDVHALLLCVPDGTRVSDVESRGRTRVALHAAMHSAGYEPVDASTLYCVATHCAAPQPRPAAAGVAGPNRGQPVDGALGKSAVAQPPLPVHIPYEEFRLADQPASPATNRAPRAAGLPTGDPPQAQPCPRVVAFWLPERTLRKRLGSEWARVMPQVLVDPMVMGGGRSAAWWWTRWWWDGYVQCSERDRTVAAAVQAMEFTLVGPTTTDSYVEAELKGLRVRSPWVTGKDVGPSGSEQIRGLICTDESLARTLAAELQQQGVDAQSRILLIAERDSAFARSWPGHLEQAMHDLEQAMHEPNDGEAGQAGRSSDAPRRPHGGGFFHAWFHRGLDGEDAGGSELVDAKRPVELPTGFSSIDYLRRLRSEFRRDGEAVGIDAVGIFGQDIHDKLLILRALRGTFPDAVFFTNDLDAFYSHPSQLPHTRNLLVASGHGLLPELERTEPAAPEPPVGEGVQTPFRNGYQTSTYLAILSAVRPELAGQYIQGTEAVRGGDSKAPPGMVFEIGSRGPVRLTAESGLPLARGVGSALALVAVLVVAALLHWRLRGGRLGRATAQFLRLHRDWHLAALGVTALCALAWVGMHQSHEPTCWLDGVSIWPSEVIRLLALAITMVFAYHVCRALRRATRWTAAGNPTGSGDVNAPPLLACAWAALQVVGVGARRCCEPVRRLLRRGGPALGSGGNLVVASSSSPTSRRDLVDRKARSAFVMALLLFAVGWLLMWAFGFPRTPARDALARVIDLTIVTTAVVAMLWLVFLVIEVARQYAALCEDMVRRLPVQAAEDDTCDPTPALDRARNFLQHLAGAGGTGIYGPFIVILLLCLARWRGFDAWTWPFGLQLVIGISGACVLFAHVALHRAATRLRERVLRRVANAIELEHGSVKRLGLLRDELKGLDHGIFAGPANHPLLRAVVIPFTGIGGLQVLHWAQVL